VADLSRTLNDMLTGLQSSMLATRRFTADAGHELRTPLTSLGIDLESLRRNPDLPAATRVSMLDAMTVEHARIVDLLDGLQNLARGDTGTLPTVSRIDVAELVQDCVTHVRRRYPSVHFHYEPTPDRAPTVSGWPQGMQVAVGNLLTNAAVHGRAHGNVEVTVREADDGTIAVAIADDGPGIPAQQRDEMKQRFVRGPGPRGRGSGLGLALAEQQAALHGGTLSLDDSPSGGLLAVITLPAAN
jgi:signal transduction histidine kinase